MLASGDTSAKNRIFIRNCEFVIDKTGQLFTLDAFASYINGGNVPSGSSLESIAGNMPTSEFDVPALIRAEQNSYLTFIDNVLCLYYFVFPCFFVLFCFFFVCFVLFL